MYIGHIPEVETPAISGVGVVFPLVSIINAFASLCGSGGAPLCSIARDEGRTEDVRKIMETAFTMLLFLGVQGVCTAEMVSQLIGASFCYTCMRLTVYRTMKGTPDGETVVAETRRNNMDLCMVSAILLAGGKSSRMGLDKTELLFRGSPLVEYQVKKLEKIGFSDILAAGYRKTVVGARTVEDLIPGRGPLSGIHTGLVHAVNSVALVLGVDVPLVPAEWICRLVARHLENRNAITLLASDGRLEPLIGIYSTGLCSVAEEVLKSEDTSLRALLRRVPYDVLMYEGDERLLLNCNCPSEYAELKRYEAVEAAIL